jgi:hypothetical protein
LTGSVTLVDKTWRCTGPVDLDLVSVTITANAPLLDAVLLDKGCSGRIGNLLITQYQGDGVKIGGAQNLTVESATIRCFAHASGKHQDGIQILGGSHIRLLNFDVGCYSANNSQVWMNPAGVGHSTGASDVVFVGGHFQGFFDKGQYGKGGSYGFANVQSTDSGVMNAVLCPGSSPKLTYYQGVKAVNPVNVGNTIEPSCTGGTQFPATAVLDTFDRAAEDPLSFGGKWSGPVYPSDPQLKVSNNQAAPSGSATYGGGYWSQSTFGPDCEAYATNTGDGQLNFYLRGKNLGTSSMSGYFVKFFGAGSTAEVWTFASSSAWTLVGTITGITYQAGDVLGVRATGSMLGLYQNGTLIGSVQDSTYNRAGYIGVEVKDGDTFDSFGGGTSP